MSRKRNKQGSQAVAVFADCQNVGNLFKHRQAVLAFIEQFGSVPLLWAYDYWRKVNPLREQQFQMDGWQCVDVATQTTNALDELLISACRQQCQFSFIRTVVLISGDGDFVPLAQWLISQNKRVIIIGRRHHVNQKLRTLAPNDTYAIEDLQNVLTRTLKAA